MSIIDRLRVGALTSAQSARRAALLALLTLAGLAGLSFNSMHAEAVNYSYCTSIIGAYDHCDGSAQFLRASQAYDDYGANRVCAGAVSGGSFYGSYACGYNFASQCYGGGLSLNPRVHNGEGYAQSMHGRAYHSENCP